jgi:hypothetical protein
MKKNYASFSIAVIAAAYAGIALAAILAVRSLNQTLVEMARIGGGIRGLSEGILEAARWPAAAAWIAAIASLVILLLAVPAAKRQRAEGGGSGRALPWLAAVALAAGAAAVLLFRTAMEFVTAAVFPGAQLGGQSLHAAIASRLLSTEWIAAACCVMAVVVGIVALRAAPSRGAFRAAVFSLVLSLGVSSALIVTLRDLSGIYEDVLKGDTGRLHAVRAELR